MPPRALLPKLAGGSTSRTSKEGSGLAAQQAAASEVMASDGSRGGNITEGRRVGTDITNTVRACTVLQVPEAIAKKPMELMAVAACAAEMVTSHCGISASDTAYHCVMADRKAVIKNADMSEAMQQDAIDCATQALEKYNVEKDIATFIKKEFEKKYHPKWHCIVGRNFYSNVTYETNRRDESLFILLSGTGYDFAFQVRLSSLFRGNDAG
mmetsp:Transcript_453/g.864  ORF Transcript_453/g.864 Transcript_453/m.864 type:complete len:211 (+) Transcript_453:44-676(+)